MEAPLFYEEQSFRNKWIFILALFVCLSLFGLMVFGLIRQVFAGIPFGTHPLSNGSMWGLAVFGTLFCAGIPLLIYKSKLSIKVTPESFFFRYFPFQIRYKKINPEETEKIEIKKFNPLKDYGGWGIRIKMIKKETAYIVSGNLGVEFTFKGGRKILVGTKKPEELLAAIKKIK